MPRNPNDQCSRCGKPVWRASGSRPEIVCQACRRASRTEAAVLCEQCGDPVKGSGKRFCSRVCSNRATNAARSTPNSRKGRTCVQCGATYDAGNTTQLCCSVGCRRAYDAARRPPKPRSSHVYFPACNGCGQVFSTRHATKRWCSERCWLNAQNERVTSFYALACQVGGAGAGWRKHLVGYLVERDGSKCGICRRKVDVALPSGPRGDGDGPSIDHIVPRSQGGSDDLANLRLTHWRCNRARRAAGGNEQLALVG